MDEFDEVTADKEAIDGMLADDKALARKCKVRGTPTVMINDKIRFQEPLIYPGMAFLL